MADKYAHLRKKAEKLLKEKKGYKTEDFFDDIEKLVEELNIHQIELEMQNQELIQTNHKWQQEKEKYKNLYMLAPVAYFTLNETGNIIELNQAAADMLKLPLHQFKYTSIFPYLHPDSKTDFKHFFKRILQNSETQYGEIIFKDNHENLVYGSLSAIRFFDQEQNQKLIRCTVVDETKTKQYEREINLKKELAQTEDRLRSMFEKTGVVMLLIDPQTKKIEQANNAAARFYGYSESQLCSMKISDINVMSEKKINTDLNKVVQNTQGYFNFKHRLASGIIKDVEVYSTAINYGSQQKLFSIIHDITVRKQSEQQNLELTGQLTDTLDLLNETNQKINKERQQFLAILDSIPEMIYVADFDTHEILFANKKLRELVGRDVTGEQCYQAIQLKNQACEFCTNKHIRNTDEPYIWEKFNPALNKHFYLMDRRIQWTHKQEARFELAIDITPLKNAQQALKESEEKFRALAENTADALSIIDNKGRLEYASPSFQVISGYSLNEIAQYQHGGISELGHPDDSQIVLEKIEQALSKKQGTLTYEYRTKHKNGHYIYKRDNVSFVYDENGNYQKSYVVSSDISPLIKVQKELQASKEQYEILSKLTFEGIILHEKGIVQQVNQSLCNLIGYEPDELIGKQLIDLAVYPNDKPIVYKQMAAQSTTPYEVRAVKKDGTVIPVELEGKNTQYNKKKIRVVAVRDITYRKQQEKALKQSETLYRTIINSSLDGVVLVKNNRQIQHANDAYCRMSGYSNKELASMVLDDIVADPPESVNLQFELVLQGHSVFESAHRKKNGELFFVEVSASFMPEIGAHVSFIRDITQRKKAEKLLHENQIRINQYNQQLKEANAAKDKFFKIIAHDLKGPFQSILGFSSLLHRNADQYDKPKIKHFAQRIHSSGENTFKLLENLLTWSRSQTGAVPFNPDNYIAEDTVIDIIQQATYQAKAKNISLLYSIVEAITVYADINMLQTILRNLVSNALKFTEPGGKITIKVTSDHSETLFCVADSGVGMSPDTVGKLFKVEEKISTRGTNDEIGTGLGLLLSKEFVERHGGKIWVESEQGKGSRFYFSLPAKYTNNVFNNN